MKHTIKIDPLKSISIEPVGTMVLITINAAGVPVHTQPITTDQAAILSQALAIGSLEAEKVRLAA